MLQVRERSYFDGIVLLHVPKIVLSLHAQPDLR
jgi:hypothetical protein